MIISEYDELHKNNQNLLNLSKSLFNYILYIIASNYA